MTPAQKEDLLTIDAVRTWKRDGSQNVMPLGAAIESVRHSSTPTPAASEVYSRLMGGEVVETPCATFRVLVYAG